MCNVPALSLLAIYKLEQPASAFPQASSSPVWPSRKNNQREEPWIFRFVEKSKQCSITRTDLPIAFKDMSKELVSLSQKINTVSALGLIRELFLETEEVPFTQTLQKLQHGARLLQGLVF